MKMEQTERSRNVGAYNSDAEKSPKRMNTIQYSFHQAEFLPVMCFTIT
jgi:hypothetical protein